MASGQSDITRYSRNFNGLLFTIGGLATHVVYSHLSVQFGTGIPPVLVTAFYFALVSTIYRKMGNVYFIFVSLLFLTVYFTVISGNAFTLEGIAGSLGSNRKLPILLYSLVILPASFIGGYIDVFSLAKNSGRAGHIWLKYLVPVLIKRELVLKRHKEVMEAFYAKGYNTHRRWVRYKLAGKWIIPVVITTLMEGVESYEYNLMLNHDITLSGNRAATTKAAAWQWALLVLLVAVIIIFFII